MSYALLNAARSRQTTHHPARSQPLPHPVGRHGLRHGASHHAPIHGRSGRMFGVIAGLCAGAVILFLGGAMIGFVAQMDSPQRGLLPAAASAPLQLEPAPAGLVTPARPIVAEMPPPQPLRIPYAVVYGVMPVPLGPQKSTAQTPPQAIAEKPAAETGEAEQVLRQLPPISSVSLVLPGFGMVPKPGGSPLTTPIPSDAGHDDKAMSLAEALARMPQLPMGAQAAGVGRDPPKPARPYTPIDQTGAAIEKPAEPASAGPQVRTVTLGSERQSGANIYRPSHSVEAATAKPAGQFVIQAAAFQNSNSAESLMARLKRAGLPVKMVVGGGWYLVRVGPYGARDEANAALSTVTANGAKSAQIFDLRR